MLRNEEDRENCVGNSGYCSNYNYFGIFLNSEMDNENKTDIICCIFSVLVYCVNREFLMKIFKGVMGYFVKCYLNDLTAPIFVLAVSSIILKWEGYELKKLWLIILIGLFAGLVWEFIIPLIKTSSVTDPYDLFCYFIGTLVYYGIKKFATK